MTERKLGLDDAYAVQSPEDNRALYRDWAESYESDFAISHGWICYLAVAGLFVERVAALNITEPGSVLDVGCGTGVVGVELQQQSFTSIDGIDISPEMLELARAKGCYRQLIEADVSQPLAIEDDAYAGVVSAGTFTHGHLGPGPIAELIRVGRPGAVYSIGINAEHFVEHKFGDTLSRQLELDIITDLDLREVPMYQGGGAGEHKDDMAIVAVFQRSEARSS